MKLATVFSVFFLVHPCLTAAEEGSSLRGRAHRRNLLPGLRGDVENVKSSPFSPDISYTLHHKISDLCWDGMGPDAVTEYFGTKCGDNGNRYEWTSMRTVYNGTDDVVVGDNGTPCEWHRNNVTDDDAAWLEKYFGSCGVSPTVACVPPGDEEVPKMHHYTTARFHRYHDLCWGGSINALTPAYSLYEGERCMGANNSTNGYDEVVQWNSIMTVDSEGNPLNCSDGSLAVWSRYSSNVMAMPEPAHSEWIALNLGECGVPATRSLMPHLPIVWLTP